LLLFLTVYWGYLASFLKIRTGNKNLPVGDLGEDKEGTVFSVLEVFLMT
jgi:hypothetical protein